MEPVIPTHMDPRWKTITRNTKLNIETIHVLQLDTTNYSGKDAPFVVMSGGIFYKAPKYMWEQDRLCLDHLQCYKAPDLGQAALAIWIEAILESNDPLSDIEEEELEAEPTQDEEPTEEEEEEEAEVEHEEVEQQEFGEYFATPSQREEEETKSTQAPTPNRYLTQRENVAR